MKLFDRLKNNKRLVAAVLAIAAAALGVDQFASTTGESTFDAGSCSVRDCETVNKNALKYSTTPTRILTCCLALVATACPPSPGPAPVPSAVGGAPGAGGAAATGGVDMGGSTVAAVLAPVCDTARADIEGLVRSGNAELDCPNP